VTIAVVLRGIIKNASYENSRVSEVEIRTAAGEPAQGVSYRAALHRGCRSPKLYCVFSAFVAASLSAFSCMISR